MSGYANQYVLQQTLTGIRMLLDNAQIGQRNPQLYQVFLQQLQNQNSGLFRSLVDYLQQKTQGRWAQEGIHEQQFYAELKPWIDQYLSVIDRELSQMMAQRQQSPYMPMAGTQPGFGMGGMGMQSSVFDPGGPPSTPMTMAMPVAPQSAVAPTPQAANLYHANRGTPVMFDLRSSPRITFQAPVNGVLTFSDYLCADFEGERIITSQIALVMAENSAQTAVAHIFREAPADLMRGTYANIVRYRELIHIPLSFTVFRDIAAAVWDAYHEKRDWKRALMMLDKRNHGEWERMTQVLLHLLNPLIHQYLRTTGGALIEEIDSLNDLHTLDDHHSVLTVTHHARYWETLSEIITAAFDQIFDPIHQIHPNDPTFGDFVHCQDVAFFHDHRSKYDYGTFADKAKQSAFIDKMLEHNTVLRVPRSFVFTNALERSMIESIAQSRFADQVLPKDLQTIGGALLVKLEQLYPRDISALICLDKSMSPAQYMRTIHFGRTLDQDHILIR